MESDAIENGSTPATPWTAAMRFTRLAGSVCSPVISMSGGRMRPSNLAVGATANEVVGVDAEPEADGAGEREDDVPEAVSWRVALSPLQPASTHVATSTTATATQRADLTSPPTLPCPRESLPIVTHLDTL